MEDFQPELDSTQNPEWRRFFRLHPGLRRMLPVIGVSALSSIVVVGITAAVLWQFRAPIARKLLASLPPSPESSVTQIVDAPESTPDAPEAPRDRSVTDVVAMVNPSVVSIEVSSTGSGGVRQILPGVFIQDPTTSSRVVGRGSGFFVSSNGLIVTNRHVVDFDNATFAVVTSTGKRYTASVLAIDPVLDVAMLKVQGSGFAAVTLGNSDTLVVGQSVVAFGNALGEFKNSVSTGIVSGLSRSIVAGNGSSSEYLDKVIQTDAAINPGNSGGPLVNLRGEVIGVNVAVAQGSQNIGFALPMNSVRTVIDSVRTTGTIVRPFVGIQYQQVSPATQKQLNTSASYGLFVQVVTAGSPAEAAGIKQGDVILSIDGTKLDENANFASIVRLKKVGQRVALQVYRDGVVRTVNVTLAKAPSS